jgi:hypothetical protein
MRAAVSLIAAGTFTANSRRMALFYLDNQPLRTSHERQIKH